MPLRLRLLLVATFSLGFLSWNPYLPQGSNRRPSSSTACVPAEATAQQSNSRADESLPAGMVPWMQETLQVQRPPYDPFEVFRRQLAWQQAFFSGDFSQPVAYYPIFPNYALPTIYDHPVSLERPKAVPQIWGGLLTDPQLAFLRAPRAAPAASGITVGTAVAQADASSPVAAQGTLRLAPLPEAPGAKAEGAVPFTPSVSRL